MPGELAPIRSEEVDDILGRVPTWVMRSGNSLLALVFAMLFVLSWLVQYPDVVPARITITALEPPVRLVAQVNGRLDTLLVTEGQAVAHGDWLGILENAADYRDVQRVMRLLPDLEGKLREGKLRESGSIELPETCGSARCSSPTPR